MHDVQAKLDTLAENTAANRDLIVQNQKMLAAITDLIKARQGVAEPSAGAIADERMAIEKEHEEQVRDEASKAAELARALVVAKSSGKKRGKTGATTVQSQKQKKPKVNALLLAVTSLCTELTKRSSSPMKEQGQQ